MSLDDVYESVGAEGTSPDLALSVIGGERVTQMTKTYNDIDAVTKLLNEKEYDLELAARIGQALLQENLLLKEENAALNTHSSHTQEKVAQLMHEMKQKNEIIKMFFQEEAGNEGIDDSDESVFDISSSRPSGEVIQVLQYKVERLEQENQQLKSSAEECVVKTDYYEEREKTLLKDCVNEIAHTNAEARAIRAELDSKCTQLHKQQEEKTRLLAELVDIQKKYNSLTVEYEQVMCELETLQECTDDMAQELLDVKAQYESCASMLHDAQAELNKHRQSAHRIIPSRSSLGCGGGGGLGFSGTRLAASVSSSSINQSGSIAEEIEHALNPEEVRRTCSNSAARQVVRAMVTSRIGNRHRRDKIPGSNTGPLGEPEDSATSSRQRPQSIHGLPTGGSDMESAIRRLGNSRQTEVDYKMFRWLNNGGGARSTASEHSPTTGVAGGLSISDSQSHLGTIPRRSVSPARSSVSVVSGSVPASRPLKPQKLQIVKPLEGSETLSQWQRLDVSDFSAALFEERPGVVARGGGASDIDTSVYSLDDIEEDESPVNKLTSTPTSSKNPHDSIFKPEQPNNQRGAIFSKGSSKPMVIKRGANASGEVESEADGLNVFCSNCNGHYGSSRTPRAARPQRADYSSPLGQFTAASPISSTDPVPPRILQILGFIPPSQDTSVDAVPPPPPVEDPPYQPLFSKIKSAFYSSAQ